MGGNAWATYFQNEWEKSARSMFFFPQIFYSHDPSEDRWNDLESGSWDPDEECWSPGMSSSSSSMLGAHDHDDDDDIKVLQKMSQPLQIFTEAF